MGMEAFGRRSGGCGRRSEVECVGLGGVIGILKMTVPACLKYDGDDIGMF